MLKNLWLKMLAVVFVFSFQIASFGTVWYVDENGNDLNDGLTPATAFRNFEKVFQVMTAGDTAIFDSGIYPIQPGFREFNFGRDQFVTFKGQNMPVFLFSGSNEWVIAFRNAVVFDGFRFKPEPSANFFLTAGAVKLHLKNNIFHRELHDVFQIEDAFELIISGNTFFLPGSFSGTFKNLEVVNNVFVFGPFTGGQSEKTGLTLSSSSPGIQRPQIISNNTLVGFERGMILDFGENPTTVQNNIISSPNGIYGIDQNNERSGINTVIRNNLISNYSIPVKGSYQSVQNTIVADPLFVSLTDTDFHLQIGSPAIDSGVGESAPLTDVEGNVRPQDGNGDGIAQVDIGAFEFVSVNTPVGNQVAVNFATESMSVTFANVSVAGQTTVTRVAADTPIPGFQVADCNPAEFFVITTTATFTTAKIEVTYDPSCFVPPPSVNQQKMALRLLHFDGVAPDPDDVTQSNQLGQNKLTSIPLSSFSPFVVAVPVVKAAVRVEPQTLEQKSATRGNGVLTLFVEGIEDAAISDIIPETVRLLGASPVRSELAGQGKSGGRLLLQYRRGDLDLSRLTPGAITSVEVTGVLQDGRRMRGTAAIFLRAK